MLSTRILLLPAVCTAMAAAVAQKHDLFPPQADAILSHPGAMDSLLLDWDRDGDIDIVTYFALDYTPQRAKVLIKFWRNDGRKPPTFVDDTARVLGPFYEEAKEQTGRFSSIYRLAFVAGQGQRPFFLAARRSEDEIYDWDPTSHRLVAVRPLTDQLSDWDNICAGVLRSTRWSTGVATGDIDGDGYSDAVFCYRGSQPRVYLYDPARHDFDALPPLPLTTAEKDYPPGTHQKYLFYGSGARSVFLADLDRDGALECIVVRTRDHRHLWNNPLHTAVVVYRGHRPPLKASNPFFTFWYTLRPKLGEEDDYNVVGTTCSGPDSLQSNPLAQGSPSLQISLGDLNGDGWIDLVQPMIGGPTQWRVPVDLRTRIYLNAGNGILGRRNPGRPDMLLGDFATHRLAASPFAGLADLDNDGDLDVALPHHVLRDDSIGDHIWLNDASTNNWAPLSFTRLRWNGTPLEIRPERVQQDNTRYLRFADLDGDGDLDMVETNFYEESPGGFVAENPRIFWNRLIR